MGVSAPWFRDRGALPPAMSVFTQPGQQALIKMSFLPKRRTNNKKIIVFLFQKLYAGVIYPLPIMLLENGLVSKKLHGFGFIVTKPRRVEKILPLPD